MNGFVAQASDGMALLLWACDPDRPAPLATPFFMAAAAAALEVPVELYFTARSVHLLVPGVAAGLRPAPAQPHTVYDAMQEAARAGARFYACTAALQAQGLDGVPLLPECQGRGGAVQFMARAVDLRWRSLVF